MEAHLVKDNSSNRILVLENQSANQMFVYHYLKANSFEAARVSSYDEALKVIEEQSIGVLVIEDFTQKASDLNLVATIRKHRNLAELPIIVVSLLSECATKVAAWNAGANYYIVKPAGQEELIAKVDLCLSLHKSYQDLYTKEEHLATKDVAIDHANNKAQYLVDSVSGISDYLFYDSVTGLPGRHVFYDLLERAMVRAIRNDKYLFGLLNVTINDLDQLKAKFPDGEMEQIWPAISKRLQLSSRASDLVSRIGHNRFVILLDDLREVSDALRVANRISKSLSTQLYILGHRVEVNASIGVAVSCDSYESPESLLEDAYKASLLAKTLGKNKTCMCNKEYQKHSQERLNLEQELYDAVAGRQFIPRYMPIVNCEDETICGLEVLLRWRHPSGKILIPDDFLDLCDRDQLVLPIGYELIKAAIEQVKKLDTLNPLPKNFTINFNISSCQFYDNDLLNSILLNCQDFKFAPSHICLEVREDTFTKDLAKAKQIIDSFAKHGIGCILDRLGSTYLSMCDMLDLNLKAIKSNYLDLISDRRSLELKERYAKICLKISDFLDCQCIINGVSNAEQAKLLAEAGLKIQEGYAFGKPLNLHSLEVFAENNYKLN